MKTHSENKTSNNEQRAKNPGGGTWDILLTGCALLPGYRSHLFLLTAGIKRRHLFSSQLSKLSFHCFSMKFLRFGVYFFADFSQSDYHFERKMFKAGKNVKKLFLGVHTAVKSSNPPPAKEKLSATWKSGRRRAKKLEEQ